MSKEKNILYVFTGGRKKRLAEKNSNAKDFYYGYFQLKNLFNNVEILEINHKSNLFLQKVDKLTRKIFHLPIHFLSLIDVEMKKMFSKFKNIFIVNESVLFYCLPLIVLLKKKMELKIYLFTMGLFSRIENNSSRKYLQNLIIKYICLKYVDKFLFIGKGEYNYVFEKFKKFRHKFVYVPFGVDTKFWNNKNQFELNERDYILFIGNDLNRDYDFLFNLIEKFNKEKFVIVSSQFDDSIRSFKNVEYINGKWSEDIISDLEIKNLYSKAKLTVIPLKQSLQPSGQSVALQSMSCLTPVLITRTDGFWDIDKFRDGENIYFIEKNDVEEWIDKINIIFQDKNLKKVVNNAQKLVTEMFSIDVFADHLKDI